MTEPAPERLIAEIETAIEMYVRPLKPGSFPDLLFRAARLLATPAPKVQTAEVEKLLTHLANTDQLQMYEIVESLALKVSELEALVNRMSRP